MKKHLYALSLSFCLAFGLGLTATGQAQTAVTEKNGTPQAPNYDFEVWDNEAKPWGWNSSTTLVISDILPADRTTLTQSIFQSSDKRPNSKGATSAQIRVTISKHDRPGILGFYKPIFERSTAVGALSTGILWLKNFDPGKSESCLYTNTDKGADSWAFSGRPDSVVFWVKKGLNGGRPADFTLYLHNNAKLEDRNPNGTAVGKVIGSAACKITNTDWQRISLPIQYASDETPAYLLVSFTAGNNFREVVEGDELYVDDMLLVYNPTILIDLADTLSFPLRPGESTAKTFDVPFILNGTVNPFNLNPDNIVYAELSDEHGSFDHATVLSQLTTETSGSLPVTLPADLNVYPGCNYRLRLRGTNNPVISTNTVTLDLHYLLQLTVAADPAWGLQVNTFNDMLREGSVFTATYSDVISGRHFAGWILDGENMGTATSLTLTMDRDHELIAKTDTNYYPVALYAGIGGAITLNGTETVKSGSSYENEIIHNAVLNLNAEPDFGYHFREWQLDGQTLSTDNPLNFTMTDAADLTAVFDTNVYDLTFTAVPADMGTTTNSGAHKHFTAVSSTAEAAEYAQFLYWRKAGETDAFSYEAVLPIESVSAAAAYEAVFASQTFAVTTAAEPAEGGQTAGDTSYEAFPLTERAQVEATAAEGYHFTYWTYAIDGQNQSERPADNPLIFVENGHVAHTYAFTAHFDLNRYALTAEYEHGTVTGLGTFDHNTAVTLNATPDYGYTFAGWFENGELVSADAEWTFNLTGDRELQAVFEPKTYTLTFAVRGDETLGHIAQPTEAAGVYAHFSDLALKAEPTEGNEFRYWIINGDTAANTADYTLAVDGEKTVEAVFSIARKRLTVLNPQDDRGTTPQGGLYEHGTPVELAATPAYGYVFAHWTDQNGTDVADNPLAVVLTEDRTYTAVFEPMPFELCLDNPTPGMGTVMIDGETPASDEACRMLPYLQTVTLSATPVAEHRLVGWRNTATRELLTDNPLKLTLRADLSLTAEFDKMTYAITGAAYPAEAADIAGSGDYYLNATAVLEATPRAGFTFDGWYDEQGGLLKTNLKLSFPVEKAVYYVARFNRLSYTLDVAADPAGAGTVQGGGQALYGYNTKVTALPNEGMQFNGWFNEAGDLVATEATCYPTVLKDETLTAHFGPKALDITLRCEPAEAGRISRPGQTETDGFFYKQTVQIVAEAAEAYTFSHWTDESGQNVAQTASLDFTPTADGVLTAHFSPRAFNPNVTVMPQQAAELTELPETLVYGQTYTAEIASTDEHYRFIGWRDADGQTLSTETTYTFTFLNQPIVALFEALPVQVAVICEPKDGGAVTLTGETRYFETLTLTAQPARGYRFAGWRTEDGNTLREETTLVRRLDGDLHLTAVFEPESYDIRIAAVPEAGGAIEGPTEATYGQTVTFKATAAEGYAFQAYEDADGKTVSYESEYTTTVNGPLTLNARFEPRTYTLRAVSADKKLGQTKGSGLFAFGETATIKAWPSAAGYTFSHWSSSAQGSDTLSKEAEYACPITAENRTIYACFKLKTLQLELTANLPEAGSLTGDGAMTYGETATIEATANEGYIWLGWFEHDVVLSEETAYTLKLTENRHIEGRFAPMMWQISAFDLPENVKVLGTGEVAHRTQAVIEAVLPNTLDFVAWVDAEGDTLGYGNPLPWTALGDLQLKPVCKPHLLPITIAIEPAGAGHVTTEGFTDNAGAFVYGEDIALEVVPAHGYTFAGWEENGARISQENPYTYRLLEESELKAVFTPEGWTVTTGTNLKLGGTTSGDGLYLQGDTVTVTATANAGFEFTHWLENGEIVSSDAVYRFVADSNRLLLADFQIHYFQILVEALPAIGAKVSGSGAYSAQDTVTLSATPTNGYAFIGWECEGETLSDQPTYRFVPERDMLIVAQTKKLTTTVSANASPMEGGTISGAGEYRVGDRVTLVAIPNDHYDFLQWVDENQTTVSLEKTLSFTAGEDVRYTALFGEKIIKDGDPHIVVHPIPFTDEVHLEGESMDKIMWFNAFGVKIAQYDINSNTHTIMSTQTWPRGLYVYRIVRNSGKVVKGKALKL